MLAMNGILRPKKATDTTRACPKVSSDLAGHTHSQEACDECLQSVQQPVTTESPGPAREFYRPHWVHHPFLNAVKIIPHRHAQRPVT